MKLHYFFGCILAAASLTVWPEIGLAHGGGGGGGGGGRGSHFSGGGARFAGTQFTARSGNRFHRHFHNGNGGVVGCRDFRSTRLRQLLRFTNHLTKQICDE